MKKSLAMALALLATQAGAQTSLLTASPIPDGAETRFCYYGGLAYSKNSYIRVGGGSSRTDISVASGAEASNDQGAIHGGGQIRTRDSDKLLECVADDDGVLKWSSVATVQLGR